MGRRWRARVAGGALLMAPRGTPGTYATNYLIPLFKLCQLKSLLGLLLQRCEHTESSNPMGLIALSYDMTHYGINSAWNYYLYQRLVLYLFHSP